MVATALEVLESEAVEVAELRREVDQPTDLQATEVHDEAGFSQMPVGTTREQLVLQIRFMNPGATRELLTGFDDRALRSYLDHLKLTILPRGTRWVRSNETPGIVRLEADVED